MHDTIERSVPEFLRRFSGSWNRATQVRTIVHDAQVHPRVVERFGLASVVQCAGSGPYRPKALENHDSFKHLYGSPSGVPALPTATAMQPAVAPPSTAQAQPDRDGGGEVIVRRRSTPSTLSSAHVEADIDGEGFPCLFLLQIRFRRRNYRIAKE